MTFPGLFWRTRSTIRRMSARVAYMIFALVTDIGVVAALLIYGSSLHEWPGGIMTVMWGVWAFFLTAVPKILFGVGGILDFAIRLIIRRRSVVFRALALIAGAVTVIVMVLGATVWRTKLRVEEVEICSDRVPESFDGYRIVQFSDVHLGTLPRAERRLRVLVDSINELQPDMIVSTGDLVNISHRDLRDSYVDVLSQLSAPDGVWSVWGNHDLGFYMQDGAELTPEANLDSLTRKVEAMGWGVLSDRSVVVGGGDGFVGVGDGSVGGGDGFVGGGDGFVGGMVGESGGDYILLTGLDYPAGGRHNANNQALAGVDWDAAFSPSYVEATGMGDGVGLPVSDAHNPDLFSVVLAHNPEMWDEIVARGRGDLTLSGHTHAMQMKFRLWGEKPWSLAQYLYKHWTGLYVKNDARQSKLYVNDGIGTVGYPMRIGTRTRPEITLFTLRRCE